MAVDNSDLLKRLEKAREEIQLLSCYGYNDSDGQCAKDANHYITSVIEDLKLMIDDGK